MRPHTPRHERRAGRPAPAAVAPPPGTRTEGVFKVPSLKSLAFMAAVAAAVNVGMARYAAHKG
jgi:hypothetical protein